MRDDFTCRYCGKHAPDVELQVDHVHPRSKGGPDTDDNFVTACVECNRGKSNIILPRRWVYCAGPKDGQTVARQDEWPVEWIWRFNDGELLSLTDALADAPSYYDRVVLGPLWHFRKPTPSLDAFVAKVDATRDEHRNPTLVLEGAYVADLFPHTEGRGAMDWLTPADLLTRLNVTDRPTHSPSAIRDG